ncbi:MAG: sialate O-acetylesterase [Phycisphaerales bacterium]|nr:sialate O-acetylesterase [Phycisphaerales bacterium]
MKKWLLPVMVVIGFLSTGVAWSAEFSVAKIFSDHMVLQQGRPNTIWGWANPDALVTIRIGGKPVVETQADPAGEWKATLPAMAASSKPKLMTITSDGRTITINDVLVGEVWFCSGQSNMQWKVRSCDRVDDVKADANRPTIRMFTVGLASVDAPAADVSGRWSVCSPETVVDFSGSAYHMGRTISDHLGVPVGLVASSWGGSSAEAWIGPEALSTVAPGRRVQSQFAAIQEEAQTNPAVYTGLDVDDSEWKQGAVPGHSSTFGIPDEVDGIFWLRIPMEVPKHWTGRPLRMSLGMVDDDDITYFNGFEIGRTNGWQTRRNYDVPGELVSPGPAVVALRVKDGAGPGGLHGEADMVYVHPADAPEDRISLAGPASMIVGAEIRSLPAQHKPSHLYHGMLYPLKDYEFAGAAWYQGENNAIGKGRAAEYDIMLPLLIEDWRRTMDNDELPFLIVQLPNWAHTGSDWNYPRLREAQRRTHEKVPGTGLAITTDIGDPKDIHPRNKHDIGDRLGRWALVDVYGKDNIVKSGPIPRDVSWSDSGVRVEFDIFGSPLAVRGHGGSAGGDRMVAGFEVAGPTGVLMPAEATLTSDYEVLIKLPVTARPPTLVRYAWAPDPVDADLVNEAGLPASPFEYRREAGTQ